MTREEAIKEIKSWDFLEGKEIEAIHTLIPELAESDDERIRKEMVDYFSQYKEDGIRGVDITPWIAYLEKQKSAEWSEVELLFRGEKVTVKRPFYRDDKGRGYSTTEQDEEVAWNALRAWCEKKGISLYDLYPKAEWSEEDETRLTNILIMLKEYLIHHYSKDDIDKSVDWLENRVKFLRPQPKKELSIEKAIQWLDDTFYFLDNSSGRGRDCEITTHDFDSLEEMYDSFRKAVIVDSEPHWKPSEEQMKALKECGECKRCIKKLYEDLKKRYGTC